jgi:quinolinate synthetase A subunit
MSDIICTSSNAVKIVNQIPKDQPIIFAPDRNLGRYVAEQTGRDLVLWQGSCIVHETFSERKIVQLKIEHPEAEVIAHPECEPTVLRHASYIGSTTALLKYSQAVPIELLLWRRNRELFIKCKSKHLVNTSSQHHQSTIVLVMSVRSCGLIP